MTNQNIWQCRGNLQRRAPHNRTASWNKADLRDWNNIANSNFQYGIGSPLPTFFFPAQRFHLSLFTFFPTPWRNGATQKVLSIPIPIFVLNAFMMPTPPVSAPVSWVHKLNQNSWALLPSMKTLNMVPLDLSVILICMFLRHILSGSGQYINIIGKVPQCLLLFPT